MLHIFYCWVLLSCCYLSNLRQKCSKKKSLLVWAQPRFVLNLFLFSREFQPQCSYKIVLIKKKECICNTFKLIWNIGMFNSVVIISAPTSFIFPWQQMVTTSIHNGHIFMIVSYADDLLSVVNRRRNSRVTSVLP